MCGESSSNRTDSIKTIEIKVKLTRNVQYDKKRLKQRMVLKYTVIQARFSNLFMEFHKFKAKLLVSEKLQKSDLCHIGEGT